LRALVAIDSRIGVAFARTAAMDIELLNTDFENYFKGFVAHMGGVVLPEGESESADYHFPHDGIIGELKILERDARAEYAKRLEELSASWMKRGLLIVFGTVKISLQTVNPICQREWLNLLQPPIERILRKANSQIRSSKVALNAPEAKGLLLIANNGNLLHTSPEDYMNLVARALAKKTQNGEPQFPHILGVVYFSYKVMAAGENAPFWYAGNTNPNGDEQMQGLQNQLMKGWWDYFGRTTRQNILPIFKKPSRDFPHE
jgi:hypothetical protein